MTQVSIAEAQARDYDTCVIGAGAAGAALAIALNEAGQSVLVVERGGDSDGLIAQSDDLHHIVSPDTHDMRWQTNREAVGGTLHGWGGRCMPFDPEDFQTLPEKGTSGWPISYEEYTKWVPPAAKFLETDPKFEEPAPSSWPNVEGVRVDRVERLNTLGQASALQIYLSQRTTGPDILTGTDLLSTIWAGPAGVQRINMLELKKDGEYFTLPCKQVVLACGGLETTRQLLLAQDAQSDLFGGPSGPLGRYYMGHLTGSIATITFKNPALARGFAYSQPEGMGSPYRRRFVLTADTPANVAFWIENMPPQDPHHRSGELSFKYLLAQRGLAPRATEHLANILRDPLGVAAAVSSVFRKIINRNARHPQRLATLPDAPYALAYHGEHFPEYSSRVTLSDQTDKEGRRKLNVDFEYGDKTVSALADSHRMLAKRLEDSGAAQIHLPPNDSIEEAIRTKARDGYHQAGLARMSVSPLNGVVDANCRVHGTSNLFVASAAVFPVSGQANPTLSVVALALRLADHLTTQMDSTP
jgi:choline dehydrogenase-like flavoprotein